MHPTRRSLLVSKAQKRLSRPKRSVNPRSSTISKRKATPDKLVIGIVQTSKSEKSRDSILEAAAKLFRRQGYSATTLRQIAAMAKIKAGSIYYYFDSKEQILDEVLHLGLLSVFEAVKKAVTDAGMVSHRRNIRIYGQLPDTLKKPHRPLRRAYAKYWDRLFLDARRAGEIRADIEIVPLRIFVLGALNWTIEWFSLDSKNAVLQLARRTELLIFDGVKKA
jgi:TetR/AcrR family transcriptional regulator, cholesterol catabolism regulator